MNDKWLKNLHDRMADYETDAPEHLWDDIESRIVLSKPSERMAGSFVWLWARRTASVAALVAVILGAVYIFNNAESGESVVAPTYITGTDADAVVSEAEDAIEKIADNDEPGSCDNVYAHIMPRHSEGNQKESISAGVQAEERAEKIYNTMAANDSLPKSVQEDNAVYKHGNVDCAERLIRRREPSQFIAYANGSKASKRLSVGVFTAGVGAGYSSSLSAMSGAEALTAVGPDNVSWEDSPRLGIMLYNQGQETVYDVKHHQPVRVGLSFAYKINGRLGIESGATYTYLASDFRYGSEHHYYSGEQSLHYVGIPVNLKCEVVTWKRFVMYCSAGLLAEKCVSGSFKNDYVLNDEPEAGVKERVAEKPFQFSVNASAGMQYNFAPSMGAYIEPGVSYYFDDGSSLNTIYKEKPLNFNLNVGIRVTFGSHN